MRIIKLVYRITLFREDISAYAAVRTSYVADLCDLVRSTILLPRMGGLHSRLSR